MRPDQERLASGLRNQFGGVQVEPEWRALDGQVNVYSPRVDIAIGPFAINTTHEATYDEMGRHHREFLTQLHSSFAANVREFAPTDIVPNLQSVCQLNRSARCFLAVEVEGSGSRKHTMGGAINASALGRIGVSVACSNPELKKLLKMRRYLQLLTSVGKNSFNTTNLLVVTRDQMADALGVA